MKSKINWLLLILVFGNLIFYLIGNFFFNKIDFATSVIPGWHTTFIIIPNFLLYAIAFLDSILLRIFFKIGKRARLRNLILLSIIPFLLYFKPTQFSPNQIDFLIDFGFSILIILSVLILVMDIIQTEKIE